MIDANILLTWSTLALAVTVAPGPDTLLVASHAASRGFRAGLAVVAGIQLGAVWYACLFGLGLLRVLVAIPPLFLAVKILGALYLAWLGGQMIWKAVHRDERRAEETEDAVTLGRPLRQGFLSNALNPQVAVFYLAALPQFAGTGNDAPAIGALLIAIHSVIGVTWLSLIAFAASRARGLGLKGTIARWLEGATGAFFVGVAGRLALDRN